MKTSAFRRGLLLAAALLVVTPLSAAAKGCRVPVVPSKVLLVLDGRQSTEAEVNQRVPSADSVEAIHTMCWRPADSTFATSLETSVGFGVVRITTKGLVDRLVAALYRASEAGSPIATDDGVVVELNADKTQWSATLERGAMVHRCVLDVGTSPPSTTSERQRTCAFSIAEGEKYALSTEG